MALLWADDFTIYGIGGQAYMTNGNYAEVHPASFSGTTTIVADPDPSGTGQGVFKISGTANSYAQTTSSFFRKAFPSAKTTIGGAVRLWMSALPSSTAYAPAIVFCDSNNAINLSLVVNTVGAFTVYRGAPYTGTLLGTSAVGLTANAWHHVEWKVKADNSTGTVEIRVNDNVVITLTGQDTTAQTEQSFSQMAFHHWESGSSSAILSTYYRDYIVWDTTGSQNNDFMGPCYVARKTVTADSTFTWTPSSGATGYNLINEAGPVDTSYISAAWPAPAVSKFALDDVPADTTSIRGIMLMGRFQKSDGGDCTIQMSVDSGGTLTNGSTHNITTAFTYWTDILELNTATSSPFTPTEFNNLKLVINRTA